MTTIWFVLISIQSAEENVRKGHKATVGSHLSRKSVVHWQSINSIRKLRRWDRKMYHNNVLSLVGFGHFVMATFSVLTKCGARRVPLQTNQSCKREGCNINDAPVKQLRHGEKICIELRLRSLHQWRRNSSDSAKWSSATTSKKCDIDLLL